MAVLTRDAVNHRLANDLRCVLIDVLDPERYCDYHLPDAINIPYGNDFDWEMQAAVPDRTTPVIIYSLNAGCPVANAAAQRARQLGYQEVYRYAGGKEDWANVRLPVERCPREEEVVVC